MAGLWNLINKKQKKTRGGGKMIKVRKKWVHQTDRGRKRPEDLIVLEGDGTGRGESRSNFDAMGVEQATIGQEQLPEGRVDAESGLS